MTTETTRKTVKLQSSQFALGLKNAKKQPNANYNGANKTWSFDWSDAYEWSPARYGWVDATTPSRGLCPHCKTWCEGDCLAD